MFYAFSSKTQGTVNSENVTDLNEIFSCPNPNCDAEFILKSADGKKRPHFSRAPGLKAHIENCPCDLQQKNYSKYQQLRGCSLEDILDLCPSSDSRSIQRPKMLVIF